MPMQLEVYASFQTPNSDGHSNFITEALLVLHDKNIFFLQNLDSKLLAVPICIILTLTAETLT